MLTKNGNALGMLFIAIKKTAVGRELKYSFYAIFFTAID